MSLRLLFALGLALFQCRYWFVSSSVVCREDAIPLGKKRLNCMLQLAASLDGGGRVVSRDVVGSSSGPSLIRLSESRW